MTHVTCRLNAKNRDQLRNPTLSNLWYGLPLPSLYACIVLAGGASTAWSLSTVYVLVAGVIAAAVALSLVSVIIIRLTYTRRCECCLSVACTAMYIVTYAGLPDESTE